MFPSISGTFLCLLQCVVLCVCCWCWCVACVLFLLFSVCFFSWCVHVDIVSVPWPSVYRAVSAAFSFINIDFVPVSSRQLSWHSHTTGLVITHTSRDVTWRDVCPVSLALSMSLSVPCACPSLCVLVATIRLYCGYHILYSSCCDYADSFWYYFIISMYIFNSWLITRSWVNMLILLLLAQHINISAVLVRSIRMSCHVIPCHAMPC